MRALAIAILTLALVGVASPAQADTIRNRQYWLADYGISEAWNTTRGAGSIIAVIDTGVDATHPDLAGAVVGSANFSGGAAVSGDHGTMVAALAAARGHGSDDGVIGAAPEAGILAISIAFSDDATSDPQVAEAIRWAVDNGANVINMSFTRNTLDWPESWDDAFLYAAEHDVVMIAAAGNRSGGTAVVGAPATIPGVLTVAGVTRAGVASNEASSQGITIGVSAPSEQLVGATPGGGYVLWNGTSGAAPIVAGIAALVRSAHPELDAAGVINRIIATARPAGEAALYGYGLVDAAAAVASTVPAVSANPMGDLAEWVRLNRRADAPAEPSGPGLAIPLPDSTPLPASDAGVAALVPSVALLRDVGAGLLLYASFGLAFIVLVVGAVRHFRGLRRTE